MDILQRIDQLKVELEALRPLDAEREGRIMQKFRLDWNYHSNHLEGNSLTYGETKALILFGITAQGKPLKDHLEMTGHNEAIKWIEEVVKEERPLTESFIRQLHVLLLKEPYLVDAVTIDGKPSKKLIQVGQYKSSPNNVVTATGEIFYFATPEETPAMMTDLVDWYRAEKEKSELHPLQLAALFHYRFVRIHPFDDGNGRTARILMNFILLQHGLPPVIIKTEDKQNYFAALRQADVGLLEPFVEYIGENLERSLDLMVRGAKGEYIEEFEDLLKESSLIRQKSQMSNSKNNTLENIKHIKYILQQFKEKQGNLNQENINSFVDDLKNLNRKLKEELNTEIKIKEELDLVSQKLENAQILIRKFRNILASISERHPNERNIDLAELASKDEIEELMQIALGLKSKKLLDALEDEGETTPAG